jgi:IS4 transposase
MTAAVIPKNHAMPMAIIQSGLRGSFSTVGIESSFAAGEASVTATGTIVAVGGNFDFILEGIMLLFPVTGSHYRRRLGVELGGKRLRRCFAARWRIFQL